MPKNKKGGKKFKRGKKFDDSNDDKQVVPEPEGSQEYAIVEKRLGGQFLLVKCSDGKSRKCFIRGKFRKRVWMNAGDLLLISLREELLDEGKCDVMYKYNPYEINYLQSRGKLDSLKTDEDVWNSVSFGETLDDDNYIDADSDEDDPNRIAPQPKPLGLLPEMDTIDDEVDFDDI
jgi:translation initiation factor 1A